MGRLTDWQDDSRMTGTTPLRLLTIDLDDTLWPCAPTIRKAEGALHAWLGQVAPRLTATHDPDGLRRHRRELMKARPEIAHDITRVRRESLCDLLVTNGYDRELADEAIALFLRHRNLVEPYADVIPVLRELAADYCLVSVTNGNADVASTPLRGLFDLSLTATLVGAQRPDPALFHAALEWAQVPVEEALHLGDDPYLDVDAARREGMAAVWVNRSDGAWPEDLDPPEARVADLRGLKRWLEDRERAI